ncbi:MAG: phosphoribosylanthranilate isomerase [Haloarculaceae archaeon]
MSDGHAGAGPGRSERARPDGGETVRPDGGEAGRTRVKVCGITNAADRDVAVAAGADAVGLIAGVTVDTPREVDLDEARHLARGVPPLVSAVLVTMPGDAATARERVERVRPDAVQVHGLDADEVAHLAESLGAGGYRASVVATVDAGSESTTLRAYADAADALLVDSVDEDGGGGTGRTYDWARTRDRVAELDTPVVLAGGLTPDNVAEAVATVDPFAVDVATGVEREGGVKDHDAVRAFVRAATREVPAA